MKPEAGDTQIQGYSDAIMVQIHYTDTDNHTDYVYYYQEYPDAVYYHTGSNSF